MLITFPDGNKKNFDKSISCSEIAAGLPGRISGEALAARVNNQTEDMNYIISADSTIRFVLFSDNEGREIYRHSSSHILACAVKRLFPGAIPAIGPAIENGFYYDFDKLPAAETDFPKIETEIKKIISSALPFVRREISRAEAKEIFSQDIYKLEIIDELADSEVLTVYTIGDFTDLCRGPHVPHTGYIRAVKLTKCAGAYWRGSEKNTMLARIYGTSFPSVKELDNYMHLLAEAEKRDHRKLGTRLDLFSINDNIGSGLVLWHPKGAQLKNTIESFWKEDHLQSGYELISTPHIGKSLLWQISGHSGFYRENMFSPMEIEGQEYFIKPMNCPFHIEIYKSRKHSYRELPLRWAELGTVYRYEKSGVMHGLMRVRGFTQDDAHIFCTPEQMDSEIKSVLAYCLKMLAVFGFREYDIFVSTRPAEKSVGRAELWENAEKALVTAVRESGLEYSVDQGGGAFYGPKIDIKIKDAIGRSWQCSTIQFDFNLPERFKLAYTGQDGSEIQPYMIHRALFGSIERFIGVLTEHYSGKFPLWLAPLQIKLLTVNSAVIPWAENLHEKLKKCQIRCLLDKRDESIGRKIRDAQNEYVPLIAVAGKKEEESGTVSIRTLDGFVQQGMAVDDLVKKIADAVAEKSSAPLLSGSEK
ncbi:MAG: threonine--tRNA ligase [Spirochaetes bacterium GWF1_41_5]|nr:MAG: threonine--tRNA ligase [Spirochaetes bacterium GWF1_41_5]